LKQAYSQINKNLVKLTDLIAAAIELSWSIVKCLKQAFSQINNQNGILVTELVVVVTTQQQWEIIWTSSVITS
jgi:hypothetical protein